MDQWRRNSSRSSSSSARLLVLPDAVAIACEQYALWWVNGVASPFPLFSFIAVNITLRENHQSLINSIYFYLFTVDS